MKTIINENDTRFNEILEKYNRFAEESVIREKSGQNMSWLEPWSEIYSIDRHSNNSTIKFILKDELLTMYIIKGVRGFKKEYPGWSAAFNTIEKNQVKSITINTYRGK